MKPTNKSARQHAGPYCTKRLNLQGDPPDIRMPGGWEGRRLDLASCELAFWAPAEPDALLDDAETVAAHGPTAKNPGRSDLPLWPYVWPTGQCMARLVFAHDWRAECAECSKKPSALELGAGVGLVGLAGLAAGLCVTFSDYQEHALKAASANARQNGYTDFETMFLDWFADWTDPDGPRFPVILGSDVIYEQAIHQPVLNVLDRMLAPGGVAWLGDPGRTPSEKFVDLASNRGYHVEIQDDQSHRRPAFTPGQFQLLILRARE